MNYHNEVIVSANPEMVFEAITKKLGEWWGKTDLPVSKVGDEFTTNFGNAYWKFRVTEYVPDAKITWKCIDGQPEFNNEWVGTTLFWNIESSDSKTKINFMHDGLTPDFKCYDICAPTWDQFISTSLKSFVEIGKGMPHFS